MDNNIVYKVDCLACNSYDRVYVIISIMSFVTQMLEHGACNGRVVAFPVPTIRKMYARMTVTLDKSIC